MTDQGPADEPVPLGFKIVVILAGLYLGWRLVQGVAWLAGRLW